MNDTYIPAILSLSDRDLDTALRILDETNFSEGCEPSERHEEVMG